MSLDVFDRDIADGDAFAQQHLAQDLPAGFTESFEAAWRAGLLFGNSDAETRARIEGVQEFIDGVRSRTGVTLVNPALGGGTQALEEMNAQLVQLSVQHPDMGLHALDWAEIDRIGADTSARARAAYSAMNAREQTWGGTFGSLAGAIAAGSADPVNIVTVPLAAPRALGIVGTALATGGITGGTQLGIEALTEGYKERVAPGYAASGEAGANVVSAAAFGGVLGGGLKGLSALWARWQTGAWPRSVRDAGNIVASEGQIDATNRLDGAEGEMAHRTLLQRSIDALVSGRPVNDDGAIGADLLRGYGARLDPVMEARAKARGADEFALTVERDGARLPPQMERLSERQLAEIRDTYRSVEAEAAAGADAMEQEGGSISAGRSALDTRRAEIDALRDEVDGLRADVETARRRIADARPPADDDTAARLAAVERDLAAPGLPSGRRLSLEAERRSVESTLAATAPGDARRVASLTAEAKGLARALARREKALDRATAAHARAQAKLDARDTALPARKQAQDARAAGRREAASTELRRAVARLASDGYGVRLPRDDADALAGAILAADDAGLDAALRGVTETLVDRALQLRRAGPPDRRIAGLQARTGYWIDQTRKRVQALAREVGHDMPREDAAAIAGAIAHAPSDDAALALLDEVMLRPRTIAATLPGTTAARVPAPASPPDVRPEQLAALSAEVTPARAADLRAAPEVDAAVLNDLDRLRAAGDAQVPLGERLNERGDVIVEMRSVDDLFDEADARLSAAREIAACAVPQAEAAE